MFSTWEEKTKERLQDARDRLAKLKSVNHEEKVRQLEDYIKALENVLKLTKQNDSLLIDNTQLQNQSTWKNIVQLAEANKGIFAVTDITNMLIKASIFTDRNHARNVIYSTLFSHRNDVKKLRKGVYQLVQPVSE